MNGFDRPLEGISTLEDEEIIEGALEDDTLGYIMAHTVSNRWVPPSLIVLSNLQ
jgi:hypothetical protein